ncbi:hypothetical protein YASMINEVIRUS_823 [Yasminevirus sp. GU-2018]|uniref:Uncharacterized protein n=1 Tax=Yasminevirus sp. GU-2018 TaxID=2420051 RepID=A0A5K0U960_9VIRU|nr:hypothetical protein YASMINEVIRUS_823 [Yasminevirus sp. GU-2018]
MDYPIEYSSYEPISNSYNNFDCNFQSPSLLNLNKLFFNIKNGNYEVVVMWFLLITTIVIILALAVSDADDRAETERSL